MRATEASPPGVSHGAMVRVSVLLAALLFGACARGPAGGGDLAAAPALGQVPEFALTRESGAAVTRADLAGKAWVADFMFTSCRDVCPVLSARMATLQARYRGDDRVRLVSFSVDPGTDTPPVLAAYGARFGADASRWMFVTGRTDDIRSVVVGGFKQTLERVPGPTPAEDSILHGERFVLVDRGGAIRGFPDPKEPGEIERQLDALLAAGG